MFWNQPLIGMDIGSSSVKLCELKRGGKALKLLDLGIFPTQAVEDGEIKEPEVVRETLLMMFKKLKLQPKGRRAAVSISGSGVLIKRAVIVPDPSSDIMEQASYEATQLLPQDTEDLYLRYAPLGKPYKDGRVPMVLVGARRELVEQYVGLIRSVGLGTGVIDCGPLCIANMFDYNYPVNGAMVVIANIGASSTQVVVTFNGEFLYCREVPIGGRDYNLKIMNELGVDEENAESLKLSASYGDQSVSENINDVINFVNEQVCTEIETTLSYFFENEDCPEDMSRKGYVFLVGGAARSIGLDTSLAATLQMPIQVANPFQRLDFKSSPYKLNYLLAQGSLYGTSVGLGLRKFQDTI